MKISATITRVKQLGVTMEKRALISSPPNAGPTAPPMPTNVPMGAVGGVPENAEAESLSLQCVICNLTIKCLNEEAMVTHLERAHQQKVCPICSVLFDAKDEKSEVRIITFILLL